MEDELVTTAAYDEVLEEVVALGESLDISRTGDSDVTGPTIAAIAEMEDEGEGESEGGGGGGGGVGSRVWL